MLKYIFESILPPWAPWGSRWAENYISSLWLAGTQYDHIDQPYTASANKWGHPLKQLDKRPSVRLNLPALGARIASRKLFVGKHAPNLEHDDDKIVEDLKWLVRASKLFWHGQDAAYMGQAGSVALAVKVVEEKPVISVIAGKNCMPLFDDANELAEFQVSWTITGAAWLGLKTADNTDCDGNKIDPESQYWFIRVWNKEALLTCKPIPVADWNPENGDNDKRKPAPDLSDIHNLGFVPIVWIQNMPNGNNIDGLSSFWLALNNCIHLDHTLSQFGKGFNYMGNPQLMVKGKIITSNRGGGHTFGPEHLLQLPADKREKDNATSGADAKLIEMSADGMKVGLENWIEKVKHWTLEQMSFSRKDPNTLKGTMSGTAIMLLDEDFYDYVEGMKVPYGEYGILTAAKMLIRMLVKIGSKRFSGISEEQIEEIHLAWPRMYEAEPEEVQALVTALADSVTAGFMETEEGTEILESVFDRQLTTVNPEDNDLLAKPGIPDPVTPGAVGGIKAKPKAKTAKKPAKK